MSDAGRREPDEVRHEAWIHMVSAEEAAAADGPLAEMYAAMQASAPSRPSVYQSPSGEPANIVRCHSLDPTGMKLAFGVGGPIHWGPRALPWATREMINTVTSQANNCFY